MAFTNWARDAAIEIEATFDSGDDPTVERLAAIIADHCPMKIDVAYMPVPRCGSCKHWDQLVIRGVCTVLEELVAERVITPSDFGCVRWGTK